MAEETDNPDVEGTARKPSRVRSPLRFILAANPKPVTDPLTVASTWREITVASAHAATAHANEHENRARRFLAVGVVTAFLGLCLFLGLITGLEWSAFYSRTHWIKILESDRKMLAELFERAEQDVEQDAKRKFDLLEAVEDARKASKDPAYLKEFEAAADKAVIAIKTSDEHRRSRIERDALAFHRDVQLLERMAEGEEKFYWHRDLLPLARTISVLLFVEVLAGFFLALSRRQEALALYWKRERRACERVLAMPGTLADVQKTKAPISETLVAALAGAGSEIPPNSNDANPTVDALNAIIAGAKGTKSKPPEKE